MTVRLMFLHGWGFDSAIWDGVVAQLDGLEHDFDDRGYFGAPCNAPRNGPTLAVAHSFGAMRLLADPPPNCAGLVAINGFDCFAARHDFAGVPVRVLDRMIARFAVEPDATLADFRMRCGASGPLPTIRGETLGTNLLGLRDADGREQAAAFDAPILSLQGGADPILSPAMRDAVFAQGKRVTRMVAKDGGHLLPLTHPELCVQAILQLAERVA